jgi:hypothetical protein
MFAQALINSSQQQMPPAKGGAAQVQDTLRISKDSFYSSFFSSKRFGFNANAQKTTGGRGGQDFQL